MNPLPTVEAEITFLSAEEGGRSRLPDLSSKTYRPHLVVQSSDIRKAAGEHNAQVEDYLGVCVIGGANLGVAGEPVRVTMGLMYYPGVSYEALQPGATFTIREGSRVVGYGYVICRGPST